MPPPSATFYSFYLDNLFTTHSQVFQLDIFLEIMLVCQLLILLQSIYQTKHHVCDITAHTADSIHM